ncbi:MAG TPA: MBL fold metallo-hydrolase, partial [Candidatus Binatia bacterium]|nr:MBL fold metallo-hydrolase [Candidatus Binatia bacterium]
SGLLIAEYVVDKLARTTSIGYPQPVESTIRQAGKSTHVIIGPEGATNFAIVKSANGGAMLIDCDIRRIDEVEEALKLTGCSRVEYLINTHEHFDHTSANFYFRQRGVPIVASAGCVGAMRDEGGPDFARMLNPVPELYDRFPGLSLTLPDVVFTDITKVTLPGVTLHLEYRAENGHSHSKGDTTLYLEEDEILIAGDLLYTEVHPVTFFGNIPNWLTALKPLFENHYKHLVPGHGPTVEGEQAGRTYFKKMYDYLEDFYGNLQEINLGRKSREEVAKHMRSGAYAPLGKTRMVERNINQFLTGKWF